MKANHLPPQSESRSDPATCRCDNRIGVLWAILLGILLSSIPRIALGQIQTHTLSSLVEEGFKAFESADYAGAARIFDSIEEHFGEEPEFQERKFQRILLPTRAFAQLSTGQAESAAGNFSRFLEDFPDDLKRRAFILYSLARAYYGSGKSQEAIRAFEALETQFPGSPEGALATLRRAELLFEAGRSEEGFTILDAFYSSDAAFTLRMQARLRSLQHALERHDTIFAKDILLSTPWKISTMPELALLAFSALEVGDRLLESEQPADAVRCYRFIPPKATLVILQELRLNELQTRFKERSGAVSVTGGSVWTQFYRQLIDRIEKQLNELRAADDYTPGYLLRHGQAMLLDKRIEESSIVFQELANDGSIPEDIRSNAHYRWVLAAQELTDWDRSIEIARSFIDSYPDSPLGPQTLSLIAQALQERQRFDEAVGVLNDLLREFPHHDLAHRWVFNRGFCFLLAEAFSPARDDFQLYLANWPEGSLTLNAELWHALSWLFEKQYHPALDELTTLAGNSRGHRLRPEILFRRAGTLYAMREYGAALADIDLLLKEYPLHSRIGEAQVLRGDIHMGKGELLGAVVAFSTITPEMPNLYPYAVFQIGKILRALEEYDRMIRHFEEYLEKEEPELKVRVSEALYWIGWAHSQLGRLVDAFPVYYDTLKTYGNDPESSEINLILKALQTQYARLRNDVPTSELAQNPILRARDFESWLNSERESALEHGYLTYYARINTFLAQTHYKRKRDHEGDNLMLQTVEKVPIEYLDAEVLGRSGLLLERLEFPSSADYHNALLRRYPRSSHRAMAYYGLASNRYKKKAYLESRPFLKKFANEFPIHPLSPKATLLDGKVSLALNRPREAIQLYEELLRLKNARGRPHAEAIDGLAKVYSHLGEREKAIAYYQRIYTLYKAYGDLVANAYLQSALLFEELGDLQAAENSLDELLSATDLSIFEAHAKARKEKRRIEDLLSHDNETSNSEPSKRNRL